MKPFWGHPHVGIRFIRLYAVGLFLFYLAWILGYNILPEGILRGLGALPSLAGDSAASTLVREFFLIFGLNLIGFALIIGGNMLLRVRGFSFGYLIPLAWMILYGLTLGSNSFLIPMEQPLAPGLSVFARSGLYEMMAGVLMAVGTDKLARNQSATFRSPSTPIPQENRPPLKPQDRIAIVMALLLLAGAAAREAWMIMHL